MQVGGRGAAVGEPEPRHLAVAAVLVGAHLVDAVALDGAYLPRVEAVGDERRVQVRVAEHRSAYRLAVHHVAVGERALRRLARAGQLLQGELVLGGRGQARLPAEQDGGGLGERDGGVPLGRDEERRLVHAEVAAGGVPVRERLAREEVDGLHRDLGEPVGQLAVAQDVGVGEAVGLQVGGQVRVGDAVRDARGQHDVRVGQLLARAQLDGAAADANAQAHVQHGLGSVAVGERDDQAIAAAAVEIGQVGRPGRCPHHRGVHGVELRAYPPYAQQKQG